MFCFRYVNPDLTQSYCMEMVKRDLALVSIEIVSPEMVLSTRDVTISIPDKIGVAGKNGISKNTRLEWPQIEVALFCANLSDR